MTHKTRIMSSIKHAKDAKSGTFNVITGSDCPCMTSRNASVPMYSEEWHRQNASATPCNGIGLINTTTTPTAIRAIIYKVGLTGGTGIPKEFESLLPIGEAQAGDLILMGTLDTGNNVFVSIDGHDDYDAYITIKGIDYFIRDVIDIGPYEIARLVRKS